MADEAVQRIQSQRDLVQSHGALVPSIALLQPFEVLGAIRHEGERLDDHALATLGGQGLPPCDRVGHLCRVVEPAHTSITVG